MQKPLVRTLQRPNLHDLFNWRIWKLQKTRVHLQSAMHEVQRSRTRCCPSGRGWWQPTRARRGRQTLHLPLSRRVWLQWICQRERPQEGHANKQTNKCNGPSQQSLPSLTAGRLPNVCGVHPQGTTGEAAEGGGGDRWWSAGHPPQLQGRVSPGSSAIIKNSERIWTMIPPVIIMLLSNFCF